jgi:hypothetical protein
MFHLELLCDSLMLCSPLEPLKRDTGGARCVDEWLATNCKGVELVGKAQACKLKGGINGHEDVVALGSQGTRRGLGQIRIGLQEFVQHLHLPLFFVGRGDAVIVASQVTASQRQDAGAFVFVCKDLAHPQDCFWVFLEPAVYGHLL